MNKIPKWLKITSGVLVGLIIIIAIAGGSSEQNDNQSTNDSDNNQAQTTAEADRCETVPENIVANINEGFNTDGITFRSAQAVKSADYESVFFISGDLQGPGLEGEDDLATFATNKLDEVGIYMAVDAVANEFSVFPDGATTDARLSMSDDGARESVSCVNR